MKVTFIIVLLVVVIGLISGVGYLLFKDKVSSVKPIGQISETNDTIKLVDFSKINSEFLFLVKIPNEFETKYIPELKAINIYSPSSDGQTNIEKSQVYISFFKASKFLTLNTVDITRQDKMTIKGREAILYEITKKVRIPNFAGQPNWRNFKHQALDIRLTQDNPSYFYSFAFAPDLEEKIFNNIMDSLIFINQAN
ncbi:MAG: hypothetical protein Q7K54_05430 [Candidatus Parcubacteria bacterium]|nr:hypothetical protein [Candidatus Parcubacteria bacterium]